MRQKERSKQEHSHEDTQEDERPDHDALFKRLLTTFFHDFVTLFLPDVGAYFDADAPVEFLDKELFTDLSTAQRKSVDLIAKARFRDHDAFFLIHVENQASAQADFPRRMFRYFTRLHEKYDLPVYPVALFSYDAPQRAEPHAYRVDFPGKRVLHFDYTTIQLNRLSWRKFAKQSNPVATALMAKMKIAPADRAKVKSECLRLLATLKLDAARSELIGSFIETYLKLSASEMRVYEREFAKLGAQEQEATMEIMTSWKREGIEAGIAEGRQEGLQEGKEELVVRLIGRRFGAVSPQMLERLDRLTSEELNELGEALFDFTSRADLEHWLSRP